MHAGSMVQVQPNFILSLSNVAVLIKGELQHCTKFHADQSGGPQWRSATGPSRTGSAAGSGRLTPRLSNREKFLKRIRSEHHERLHRQYMDSIAEDSHSSLPHNGLPHITFQSKLPSVFEQPSISVRDDKERHKAQAGQIKAALLPHFPDDEAEEEAIRAAGTEEVEYEPDAAPTITGIAGLRRGHYIPLTPCLLFVIGHTNVKVRSNAVEPERLAQLIIEHSHAIHSRSRCPADCARLLFLLGVHAYFLFVV